MRRRLPALLATATCAAALAAGGAGVAGADRVAPDGGPEAAAPGGDAGGARVPGILDAGGPESGGSAAGEVVDVEQAEAAVGEPIRVRLPGLGISSGLDRLGRGAGGVLETPPRWQVAGWFEGGPRPGETGPAVIAGHLDSPGGPGVFADLEQLEPGDTVQVDDRDGETTTFRVDTLTRAPRDAFPTEAVYAPTPDPQLRLITCDGPFDGGGGGYRDNLIVFVTEVGAGVRRTAQRLDLTRGLRGGTQLFARLGVIGGLAFVVDAGSFNLLRQLADLGPLTAKTLAVALATTFAFVANREWTFARRRRRHPVLGYALFFGVNGVALLLGLGCLAVSTYVLGLTSPLAENVSANVVGVGLGTLFRFWAYHRWVFPQDS